jgi:hypothetical protein
VLAVRVALAYAAVAAVNQELALFRQAISRAACRLSLRSMNRSSTTVGSDLDPPSLVARNDVHVSFRHVAHVPGVAEAKRQRSASEAGSRSKSRVAGGATLS